MRGCDLCLYRGCSHEILQQTSAHNFPNKLYRLLLLATHHPKLATPLQPAGRQKIRGVTSSCQGKPAGVCSSGLTDSTPRPHFFDLPGTASQLTGTTDGPGVGKQARQLSEPADSNGALQNSWWSWMIWWSRMIKNFKSLSWDWLGLPGIMSSSELLPKVGDPPIWCARQTKANTLNNWGINMIRDHCGIWWLGLMNGCLIRWLKGALLWSPNVNLIRRILPISFEHKENDDKPDQRNSAGVEDLACWAWFILSG